MERRSFDKESVALFGSSVLRFVGGGRPRPATSRQMLRAWQRCCWGELATRLGFSADTNTRSSSSRFHQRRVFLVVPRHGKRSFDKESVALFGSSVLRYVGGVGDAAGVS